MYYYSIFLFSGRRHLFFWRTAGRQHSSWLLKLGSSDPRTAGGTAVARGQRVHVLHVLLVQLR